MAVYNVWWMSNTSDLEALKPASIPSTEPHKGWPWNQNTRGLPFTVLAEALRTPSNKCRVQEYIYNGASNASSVRKWRPHRRTVKVQELVHMLKVRVIDLGRDATHA
jgi:hypothetical protein